jgi:hypothetical protein
LLLLIITADHAMAAIEEKESYGTVHGAKKHRA